MNGDWPVVHQAVLESSTADALLGTVVVDVPPEGLFFAREAFVALTEERLTAKYQYREEFREPERYEFTLHNPRAAAIRYVKLTKVREPAVRLRALIALGRCYFQLKKYAEAIEIYEKVLNQWPVVLDSETAVFPLIAGIQMTECYRIRGEHPRALPYLLDVYRQLLETRWILAVGHVPFPTGIGYSASDGHWQV